MSFNLNLPLGPWFIAVVIVVALFMAVICTTILYVCCKGCSGHPISSMEDVHGTNAGQQLTIRDKPPSYRRFLRSLSNLRLVAANANNSTNRVADTGTPPPKYDDVISGKFGFTSGEIREYAATQATLQASNVGLAAGYPTSHVTEASASNVSTSVTINLNNTTGEPPPCYSEMDVSSASAPLSSTQNAGDNETRVPIVSETNTNCKGLDDNPIVL